MSLFSRISPIAAYRDLRAFLAQRRPHELLFGVLALTMTIVILSVFNQGSNIEIPYKRNIIYFQQWPLDRSEAQILAQQKIDQAAKDKQQAEIDKQQKARQAEFKKLDDKLNAWGI